MANPWMDEEYATRWAVRQQVGSPYRLELIGVICHLAEAHGPRRFLDLGCGAGAATFRLLARLPDAEAVAVDGSEGMLALGGSVLGRHAERTRFVRADLAEDWTTETGGDFDLVISTQSFHHLEAADKRIAMRRAVSVLRPGGLLLLGDRISFDERLFPYYKALWNRTRSRDDIEPLGPDYDLSRYTTGIAENGDLPDPIDDQIAWLKESGLDPVDCFFRNGNRAVFGGLAGRRDNASPAVNASSRRPAR